MQDLSEMLKAGCHFCKKELTAATAKCGTLSVKLIGTEVWSQPIAIICCEECFKRETSVKSEVSH
ncbi:MAG: hypothetical protein JWM11_2986 [Planctomycetaceae bacterium]|nr:hypothetical protein [Planctomycetaceae bacterium]